ncbi:EamA family transporter [Veronia nyctiphanis]|uniref:EamA family transporter n=1 Tax=Veronia nyctiphanis TaxID=1278244 RepID=A0A4Q0YSI8_9GAMM|nr:DMT family transporter [Veronia nyctiphanis]RXJ74207.1 EamA family transporter [Veronia nyctiphanis]
MEVKVRDLSMLVLLAALWGASFLFTRLSVPEFGPFALVFLRVAIAAAVLLPILLFRGQLILLLQSWKHLFIIGAISAAVPFTLLSYAMLTVTGGFASILNASTPIWGALIALIWLGDSMSFTRIMGLVVGFCGVVVLVWDKLEFTSGGLGWSVVAVVSATFMYGLSASYTKRFLSDVPPIVVSAGSLLGASVALLPLGIMYWPEQSISVDAWLATIMLGALCTGLAFMILFNLMIRIGPANSMTVTYIIPIFATLWGAIFLGEVVTQQMLVGAAIIFSGTALAVGFVENKLKQWRAQRL